MMERQPLKPKGKSYWSRVEQAGETMEFGLRCFLGFFLGICFCALSWQLGKELGSFLGFAAALIALPIGFVTGFFWLEIKFLLRLIFRAFID